MGVNFDSRPCKTTTILDNKHLSHHQCGEIQQSNPIFIPLECILTIFDLLSKQFNQ